METRSSPSMGELRAIAADRGLKYYRHLSKPELFSLLQRQQGGAAASVHHSNDAKEASLRYGEATERLVRPLKVNKVCPKATRCSLRLSALKRKASEVGLDHRPVEVKKKAKTVMNTVDPIMLTELGPHTFEFERSNGAIVVYNIDTLVQYILATGDFSEPETRIPFSDDNLRQIDAVATRADLKERSVLEAKKNKHEFEEQKVKRDGLLGLERCAGECVSKMLEIIENEDPEEGEIELIMTIFPSFSSIFEQIRKSDKEYAKHCMNHFKAYLRGPKNRPITDNSGLQDIILNFLDDVDKGHQDAGSFGF